MTDTTQKRERSPVAWTAAVVVGTVVGLASVLALTALLYRGYTPPDPMAGRPTAAALRVTDEAALTGYGWADKSKGVVALPIEAAMEKLIADPQPARPPAEPQSASPQQGTQAPAASEQTPAPAPTPPASGRR